MVSGSKAIDVAVLLITISNELVANNTSIVLE
jgi:hypothetical protein